MSSRIQLLEDLETTVREAFELVAIPWNPERGHPHLDFSSSHTWKCARGMGRSGKRHKPCQCGGKEYGERMKAFKERIQQLLKDLA